MIPNQAMFHLVVFFSVIVLSGQPSIAQGSTTLVWRPQATLVMQKLRSAAQIELTVERTVISELTEQLPAQKGKLYLSKALFRFESETQEILVYDGTYIWTEQPGDKDLGIERTITKSKLVGVSSSQALLGRLLTQERLSQHFIIKDIKKISDEWVYTTTPKDKKIGISTLEIKFSADEKNLSGMTIVDDIGNKTVWIFRAIKLSDKAQSTLFKYTPPKGLKVITL